MPITSVHLLYPNGCTRVPYKCIYTVYGEYAHNVRTSACADSCYFQLYENFTCDLFYVNFDEEQLLFQTFLPKIFSTRDICKKLNFGVFEAPPGRKLHQNCCGLFSMLIR